jgi:hypothetical protein
MTRKRIKIRVNKSKKNNKSMKNSKKSIFKGGRRIKQKKYLRKISKRCYKSQYKPKRKYKFVGGATAVGKTWDDELNTYLGYTEGGNKTFTMMSKEQKFTYASIRSFAEIKKKLGGTITSQITPKDEIFIQKMEKLRRTKNKQNIAYIKKYINLCIDNMFIIEKEKETAAAAATAAKQAAVKRAVFSFGNLQYWENLETEIGKIKNALEVQKKKLQSIDKDKIEKLKKLKEIKVAIDAANMRVKTELVIQLLVLGGYDVDISKYQIPDVKMVDEIDKQIKKIANSRLIGLTVTKEMATIVFDNVIKKYPNYHNNSGTSPVSAHMRDSLLEDSLLEENSNTSMRF